VWGESVLVILGLGWRAGLWAGGLGVLVQGVGVGGRV
jgi:hypothetical protein